MNVRFPRSSGIVMPIFSLPSPYGIGTMGKGAYDFVDFLAKSGQKYWQILPLGHTGFGNSPYSCFSVVAGNPYFIDLDKLVEMSLLTEVELSALSYLNCVYTVDYEVVSDMIMNVLFKAYTNASDGLLKKVEEFATLNYDWVQDYALFMAIKGYFNDKPVWEWDSDTISKDQARIFELKHLLKDDIEFYIFIQYIFFKQWKELKEYANNKGVLIIGDIPMYPSLDSVDVWINPDLFMVDENMMATGIAGVPPDYYSPTGQLWGNPTYNWKKHKANGYLWWKWRINHALELVDVLRIDHFRAFQDYWEVPAGEETAINGKWIPGPRMDFFNKIKKSLGDIPVIAEDLGIIGDDVREFLVKTGYPGMEVMVFGLRAYEDNTHMPHNAKVNSVIYTSTHDSETFCQAVNGVFGEDDREFALKYVNANSNEGLGISTIRMAYASPAVIAMTMMSDVLSLDSEGRINIPGTVGKHNWSWRMKEDALTGELAEKLYELTKVYKRLNR